MEKTAKNVKKEKRGARKIKMQQPNRFQQRQRTHRENAPKKCKISIRKKKDGTIIKEIQGECTPNELKALSDKQIDTGDTE